jgi:PAS domain S-box-containing protein
MVTRSELLNGMPELDVVFWIYSRNKKVFDYISPSADNILETDIDKVSDASGFRKLVHPEDRISVIRNINGGRSGLPDELEYRIITPKGKIKWLKNTSILARNNKKNPDTVIGCTYAISRSNDVLPLITSDLIVKNLPDSFIVIDNRGKVLYKQIGYRERYILTDKAGDSNDISTVLERPISRKIKEQFKNPANIKNQPFEAGINIGGKEKRFEFKMSRIHQHAILVLIRNITELISKINATGKFFDIAQQSKELIMITDVTGNIEYANPAVSVLTGYSNAELIGKKTSVFKSGKHNDTFYRDLWSTILKGGNFKSEFNNIKKSGEHYIEEKVIMPLFNTAGHITNFISSGRDVTKERMDEKKANKYKQLAVTLSEKEQKTRTLSLIKSNEIERRKFAKDIHEGLNQMLSATRANIESLIANQVITENEKEKIEFINSMVSEVIQELRGISTGLSPNSLYQFGLHAVVKQVVDKTSGGKGLKISFTSNLAGIRFKNEVEINVYRIIQEAIENLVKHSEAKKADVSLDYTKGTLRVLIKDNGKGITLNMLKFKKINTFGVLNMEARAKSIGADLKITSKIDKGFSINLSLDTKTTTI